MSAPAIESTAVMKTITMVRGETGSSDLPRDSLHTKELVIVENIILVRLLVLTADFKRVKTNASLTPIFKLREKSKTGIQSCLYTVPFTPIFA